MMLLILSLRQHVCFFVMQNELQRSASFLKQANVFSTELKKNVSFQFTILTDTPYSPLPFTIATGTDVDIDSGSEKLSFVLDQSEIGMKHNKGPMVCVEVKDSKHGATYIWSLSRFR